MPRETVLGLSAIIAPFVIFVLAVAWGEFQTRRSRI
jgi:hypothetical protein